MSEKIKAQIEKLTSSNSKLSAKIEVNGSRIRSLVGKLAGVKPGDVVVWKGERYQVAGILSDAVPVKGLPALLGVKLLKNGKAAKRSVEIKGAWKPEAAPKVSVKVKGLSARSVKKITKAVRATPRVSKRAALAAVAPEGTA